MLRVDKQILKHIWSQMWLVAVFLYISYFFYRWIGVYISQILGRISDVLLYQGSRTMNVGLVWELFLAFAISLFVMPMIDFLTNIFIFRKGLQYEASVITSVLSKDYETFLKWKSNEWTGRISGDPLQYRQMAVVTPTRIIADITVFIVAIVTLLRINVFLTVLLTTGTGLIITIQSYFRRKNNTLLEATRKYQDDKKVCQIELVRAKSFWNTYGCQESFSRKMEEKYFDFYKDTRKIDLSIIARQNLLQKGGSILLILCAMLYGMHQVALEQMTAGNFVTIYFMLMQIKNMMESIFKNLQGLRGYGALEERMKELLQGNEEMGNHKVEAWKQISLNGVFYQYPGSNRGMEETNFTLKKGGCQRIKGENGSGKTTLLKLICGLLPSKNEQIRVGDYCLADVDLRAWRNKISYMQQFPDIFPGTVRENVRIAKLTATEEELDQVLKKVGLKELAERQLSGAKTELSGGEIKRLELARVLLRLEQCEILLFDEPYENLDLKGQKLVQELLDDSSRTRIIVTHERE